MTFVYTIPCNLNTRIQIQSGISNTHILEVKSISIYTSIDVIISNNYVYKKGDNKVRSKVWTCRAQCDITCKQLG